MTQSINMRTFMVVVFLAAAVMFMGALSAHAQTYSPPAGYNNMGNGIYYSPTTGNYFNSGNGQFTTTQPNLVIPSGFQFYGYGIFYNPTTGQYYDPPTGQYGNLAPLGPATIPPGYSSSIFGTYFNSTSGYYLDPSTGFFSVNVPTGQIYAVPQTTPPVNGVPSVPIFTSPGLPNTGAGGNASSALGLMALAAVVALGGLGYLGRKYLAAR